MHHPRMSILGAYTVGVDRPPKGALNVFTAHGEIIAN